MPNRPFEARVLCLGEHLRVVAIEVQTATLVALESATNDQVRRYNEVS